MIAIVAIISVSVILHNYTLFLVVGIIKFYLLASLIIIIQCLYLLCSCWCSVPSVVSNSFVTPWSVAH